MILGKILVEKIRRLFPSVRGDARPPAFGPLSKFGGGRLYLDFPGWVSKLVDKGDVTDSYVDVNLGKARLVRTKVIDNNLNPKFDEHFRDETSLREPRKPPS